MTTTNAPLKSTKTTIAGPSMRSWTILLALVTVFFAAQAANSQVAGLDISAPTLKQRTPSKFVVPITSSELTNSNVIAFQFNIIYDPAVINPSGNNFGCSTNGTLAGAAGMIATCNVVPAGTLRVAVYGAYPMVGRGPVLNIRFATAATAVGGSSSTLDFENLYFFNEFGYVPTTPHNGRIVLSPWGTAGDEPSDIVMSEPATDDVPVIDEKPRSTFMVPINAEIPADSELTAFQFDVAYDRNVIDPAGQNFGCSTERTIGEAVGAFAICTVSEEGMLRVAVFSPYPLSGSGTILNLTFKTSDGAVHEVNVTNANFFGAARGSSAILSSGPAL
jgi:hypothetical protein